jgi:hypothetical protein
MQFTSDRQDVQTMPHTHSVILSAAKDLMAIANGVVEAPRGPSRKKILFNTRKLTPQVELVGPRA